MVVAKSLQKYSWSVSFRALEPGWGGGVQGCCPPSFLRWDSVQDYSISPFRAFVGAVTQSPVFIEGTYGSFVNEL